MSETRIDDLNLYDSGVNVWIAVETEAREWIENLGSDDVDAELEECFSTTVVDFISGYNVPGYNNLDNPDSISDRIEFLQGLDGYSDYEHILTNYIRTLSTEKITIGFDSCGGEEQRFCDWLIKKGYDAEVMPSTGEGIGSELQNRLWDEYCKGE